MSVEIFNQLIEQLIKRNLNNASAGAAAAYQSLCDLLRRSTRKPRSIFDPPALPHKFFFHTLNHDLHLEQLLNEEDHGAIDYDDGFSELGSPYFGRLEFDSSFPSQFSKRPYYANVRMPRFNGMYLGPVQLFKLHGSLDYWSFGVEANDKGVYEPSVVKKQSWISHLQLLREISIDGHLQYRNDFTNYHALFLSGTTAKLEHYEDPVLIGKLLQQFSANLSESDLLVVIGYGFRDEGINKIIQPFLNDDNKKVIVIDRSDPNHPAVRPDMLRLGGLEAYDFSELNQLLGLPVTL